MTVATGTLTGTLQDPTGAPLVGATITAAPQVRGAVLSASNGRVITSGPVSATTDASGHFSLTLAATDDPGTNPTGFTYRIAITPPANVRQWFDPFSMSLPTGATIDLSTVIPAAASGGVPSTITPLAVGVDSTGTPYLLNTATQDTTTQPDSKHLVTRADGDSRYAKVPAATDEVIYVAPSGSDSTGNGRTPGSAFRTLTAAVAALPTGLTTPACIRMAPGAYTEPGTIDLGQRKNLTIEGAGKGVTVLTFSGTGSSIISDFPVNSATGPTHVAFRDFTITNTNAANVGAGVEQRAGSIIDVAVGVTGHKYGVIFDQTEEGTIDLCDLQQQITGGIWLTHGADWTAGASMTPPFTNNITISRNNINEGSACVGIIDDGGWAHTIENNSINGCSSQIVIAGISGGVISGNECESAAADNIKVNTVTFKSGTAAGPCVGLVIEHNTIDTANTGNGAITFAQGGSGSVTLVSNSMSSTGYAVRGVSTVGTLISVGDFNQGTGAKLFDSHATNHLALTTSELALLGPAFSTTVKYNPPASGTTVFLDLGNGSKDAGGSIPAYAIGRGDPSLVGSLDLRAGTADTHSLRAFINGALAMQLVGNGAGSTMTLSDARDISVGTTTGSRVGTSVGQKIGFWGATPSTQKNGYSVSTPQSVKTLVGDGTDTLATVGEVLGRLITDLKNIGLLGS